MVQAQRKEFLEQFIVHTNFTRIGLKTTVCCLTLYNGFEVVGSSAPVDVRMFNKELGERYAYENALEQVDKFFAFVQQDREHVNKASTEDK